jgi:hypothetical protein
MLFSLSECGKSMALSNPDYWPELLKIRVRSSSAGPSMDSLRAPTLCLFAGHFRIRNPPPATKSASG